MQAAKGILIERVILRICYSKTELTYQETKYQFKKEVLEKEEYLERKHIRKSFIKEKLRET